MSNDLSENEVMPHRKKAKKSTPTKSKHEHKYVPCVFEYNKDELTKEHGFQKTKRDERIGYYCPICGKISSCIKSDRDRWYKSIYAFCGIFSEPTDECKRELDPETRTLPTFWLDDDFFQKYVDLTHKRNDANAE